MCALSVLESSLISIEDGGSMVLCKFGTPPHHYMMS